MSDFILIAEDDSGDLELARLAFQEISCPYPLEVARDGEEALGSLKTGSTLPILLLLDLKMPKVDGFEVLKRLRSDRNFDGLPIMVMSASNEPSDRRRALTLGADLYLTKPIDFRDSVAHARVAVELARVGRGGTKALRERSGGI